MRKIAIIVFLLILSLLATFPVLAAENVKNVTVSNFPNLAGQATQYTIGFNVSNTGALRGGRDEITIVFPESSELPDKIEDQEIFVNGYPIDIGTVYIDGRTLSFVIPANININNNGYVGIIINKSADIRTPSKSGSFPIGILTSFDTINYSDKFTLTGTSITNLEVSVNPASVNEYAEYTIDFRPSHNGALVGGQDWIYVEFPDDVSLPRSISGDYIQINGKKVSGGTVEVDNNENRVAIKVPSGINISARQQVEMIIGEQARIRNPRLVDEYDINVYTSKDTLGIQAQFSVGKSISNPLVIVSPNQAGVIGQYTIGFITSATGGLMAGEDFINIKFPDSTILPSYIAASNITVNGNNASEVTVVRSDNRIAVRLPRSLDIAGGSYVNVVIKGDAQVYNPNTAGTYCLEVSTSGDRSYTKSNGYVIIGGSVSSPVVYLSTYKTGEYPDIEIGFRISPAGELIGGEDGVTIEFPEEFDIPSSINPTNITINNEVPESVSIDEQVIEIVLPDGLDLESRDSVQIKISHNTRIRNPVDKGKYNFIFYTSKDPNPLSSRDINIGDNVSEITQNPIVELSNSKAGNNSRYLIALFNDLTILEGGDTLEIMFPSGTVIPNSISSELIKINGVEVDEAEVSGNRLLLTLSEGINIGYQDKIILTIDESAGIRNPGSTGEYKLSIVLDGIKTQESMAYNITDAQATSRRQVVFRIGSTLAMSNGQMMTLLAAPSIIENYTVVPLRNLGDALGAITTYDAATNVITVEYQGKTLVFVIGSKLARVNEQWLPIDIAPVIINGRTMIPVRFVSQSFGAVVDWNDATKEITITQ